MAADLNEPREWRVRFEKLEAHAAATDAELREVNVQLSYLRRDFEAERGRASEGEREGSVREGVPVALVFTTDDVALVREASTWDFTGPFAWVDQLRALADRMEDALRSPAQPSPGPGEEPSAHPVGGCFADEADMGEEWTHCPFCGGRLLSPAVASRASRETDAYATGHDHGGSHRDEDWTEALKLTTDHLLSFGIASLRERLRAGGRAEQQRAEPDGGWLVEAGKGGVVQNLCWFVDRDDALLNADAWRGTSPKAHATVFGLYRTPQEARAVAEPREQPEELPTLAGTGAEHIEGWAQDSEPGYLDVYGDDWFRATRSNPLSELNDPPLRRITLRLHRAEPQVGPDEALPARLMEVARSLASVNEHSAADDVKLAAARLLRGARNETLGEREGERRQYCARCHYAKDLHPVVIENWPDEQVDCKNFVAPSEAGAPQEAKP